MIRFKPSRLRNKPSGVLGRATSFHSMRFGKGFSLSKFKEEVGRFRKWTDKQKKKARRLKKVMDDKSGYVMYVTYNGVYPAEEKRRPAAIPVARVAMGLQTGYFKGPPKKGTNLAATRENYTQRATIPHKSGAGRPKTKKWPFEQKTFDESRSWLRTNINRAYRKYLDGKSHDLYTSLRDIARAYTVRIRKTIAAMESPELAPSTIEKREHMERNGHKFPMGVDKPLVETGRLMDAVEVKVMRRDRFTKLVEGGEIDLIQRSEYTAGYTPRESFGEEVPMFMFGEEEMI